MSIREIKIEPLTSNENELKKIAKLHKQLFDKDHFTSIFSEEFRTNKSIYFINRLKSI